MKRRSAGSNATGVEAQEASAPGAKTALRSGEERPIANYIRDIGYVLNLVADALENARKFDFARDIKSPPQFEELRSGADRQTESIEETEDWEGTRDQIEAALREGKATLVGWYLRDAAEVLSGVAAALAPAQRSRGWRLEFVNTASSAVTSTWGPSGMSVRERTWCAAT